MGNLGFTEILVVLIVALIVLGPNRLPGAARQLGKALQEFRRVSNDFQTEVRDAFSEPGTYPPPPSPSPGAGEATGTPPPGAPSPPVELPSRPEDAELPPAPPPFEPPPAADERPS
ncbi:MAG TPA: Sec-independent protein translocase protein TatB [Acidimicrobiales bacterium]|jgi:Tat protein translocase TatB subunit